MSTGLYIAFCVGYGLAVWLYTLLDLPAPWPVAMGGAVVFGALIAYGTVLLDVLMNPDEQTGLVRKLRQKAVGYAFSLLIAVDQLVNAVLGGEPDETLSSLAYRLNRDRGQEHWRFALPQKIINRVFWFQPQHCQQAYESERSRAQLAPEFRQPTINQEINP